ncbi:MAG: hypothetical protein EOR57_27925 [Mesorhizobium sp.]|uniref:hypothetical protein n=1 Tax=Mesorhizobium sp. TaxID=1871066 RepID=UPI000FE8FF90|nr:hypothetical protein [Mesorhizobium sp.]RWL16568.1 MAG: hypothetical protein EOR57_27925 [Mesorhizobium sp.]
MSATSTLKPFAMPAGMDPRTWRQEIEKRINELLDQSMARITALDLMEADCDIEDNADHEPYFAGWSGENDDRERDDSDNEDDGTAEPEDDGETGQWNLNPLMSQDGPVFHGGRSL